MTINYYESGERKTGIDTIKALAKVLGVKVTDFLSNRNENLVFVHDEFRKGSKLSVKQQDDIKEAVEEYLGIAEFGTVGNLVKLPENKGILVYIMKIDKDAFSDM